MLFVRGCGVAPFAGGLLLGAAGRRSPESLFDGGDSSLPVPTTGFESGGVGGVLALGTDGFSGPWGEGGELEQQPLSKVTNTSEQMTEERGLIRSNRAKSEPHRRRARRAGTVPFRSLELSFEAMAPPFGCRWAGRP
jgi:hypothetical protein